MSEREAPAEDSDKPERFSLRRWSQRKHAAARAPGETPAAAQPDAGPEQRETVVDAGAASGTAVAPDAQASTDAAVSTGAADADTARAGSPVAFRADQGSIADPRSIAHPQPAAAVPLPPIESLTADSNFAAFMRPGVDEILKRGALRKLFSDPRFNVMDGLDIYIDDYTRSDPIEPSLARELLSRLRLGGAAEPAAVPDVGAADEAAPMPGADVAVAAPELSGHEAAPVPTTAGSDADADAASQETGPADAVRGSSQPAPESR
jgi:hypothetical protein